MGNTNIRIAALLVAFWAYSAELRANTEPPAAYDARSVGMGSTGVAHVHNGASLFHNPAALQGVEGGAVTGVISPFIPQMSAPLTGPETEGQSKRSIFPMFLVGGAYRLSPKFVAGLAVFPTMGFGANYEGALPGGAVLKAQLAAIEIAPGVSYAITDDLAVGAAYRVTYMSYGMEMPVVDAATGTVVPTKVDLSGWSFLGVQIGLFARATKTTRLGLTYRNKVPVNMSGTTTAGGVSLDTEMEFASPHTFKLGVAQALLEDRLLLALDLKLGLYQDSGKSLVTKVTVPGLGTQEQTTNLDWKNAFGVYAGGEYRFAEQGPRVRLGYSLAQSATPENRAQPVMPPPGLQHAVHAGGGVSLTNLDLDLGGYYVFGGKHAAPEGNPLGNGNYRMTGVLVALSGTYRF